MLCFDGTVFMFVMFHILWQFFFGCLLLQKFRVRTSLCLSFHVSVSLVLRVFGGK
jgi:hypothetical protein